MGFFRSLFFNSSLITDFLTIVCLSSVICVVLGIDLGKNVNSNYGVGRIVSFEMKLVNVTKNETYLDKTFKLGKCPNSEKDTCMIPHTEKKTVTVIKEVMKQVPVYRCHDGYEQRNEICLPICKNDCKNGFCAGPEICECFDGYAIDNDNAYDCNPVCDECEHGECISPNYCECNDGYQWHSSQNQCIPICKTNCPNGKCIGPNKCTCNDGYRLKNGSSTHDCEPVCDLNCKNGQCTALNVCNCSDGYRFKDGSLHECEPICEPNCKNAECIEPMRCECHKDYQFRNGSTIECEPICKAFCLHGECVGPNGCKCDDGYRLRTGSLYECDPLCEPTCVNGQCVKSNECECTNGYEKFNNQSGQHICCPICGFGEDCTNIYTNNSNASTDVCYRVEEHRLSTEDNYKETTETILDGSATDILPEDAAALASTFNLWNFTYLFLLLAIISIAYWQYKNRKVDYYLTNNTEVGIYYTKKH